VVKTDSLVTKSSSRTASPRASRCRAAEVHRPLRGGQHRPTSWSSSSWEKERFPKDYVEDLKAMKPANSLFGVFLGLNIDLKKRDTRTRRSSTTARRTAR